MSAKREKRKSLKKQKEVHVECIETNRLPVDYKKIKKLQLYIHDIETWAESSRAFLNETMSGLDNLLPQPERSTKNADMSKMALALRDMNWAISIQPNNLLRIDTKITSIEQLVEAAHAIRPPVKEDEQEGMFMPTVLHPADDYWLDAHLMTSPVVIEDYKHDCMNLDLYLKSIMPSPLDRIFEVARNCLHPQFLFSWESFWKRSSDPKLNQICTDSALSRVFLHVMRHHRDLCPNALTLAGYYFGRAREGLMEYFDARPSFALVEAIADLSLICSICKRYSKGRIYMELAYRLCQELGAQSELKDDGVRKRYLSLSLFLQCVDFLNCGYSGDSCITDCSLHRLDYREIVSINDMALRSMRTKNRADFKKTATKQAFHVYLIELAKIGYQTTRLIQQGVSIKSLLKREILMAQWHNTIPDSFVWSNKNGSDVSIKRQASILLRMQYERYRIDIHKCIVRNLGSSPQERENSRKRCFQSATDIVMLGEVYDASFEWCVFQWFALCVYQASTVFCMIAMDKTGEQETCGTMILRVMHIIKRACNIYEGLPDSMSRILCEFLKRQGLHNDLECACNTYLKDKQILQQQQLEQLLEPILDENNSDFMSFEPGAELTELQQLLSKIVETSSSQ